MTVALGDVSFRTATAADSDAIAALHAASWRAHYRGSASDAYLDGPIEAERRVFWATRLATPRPDRVIVLAEADGRLVGFVCAIVGADQRWGSLVDNLHVVVDLKRGGTGRALMRQVAARIPDTAKPVHLFVLEANHAARAFYDRIGGEPVGTEYHALPDGTGVEHPVIRYAWLTPDHLARCTEEQAR